jgi:17beta-estradiol 17-dehydrogenase / very-long-chain 3-oxoacyl-CoA reductase
LARLFYKSFFRKGKILSERYGLNSWVVITGNIDGVGKSFCWELARKGFHICMISNNNYKLVRLTQQIRSQCPNIQTKIVTANFNESLNDDFFKKIDMQIQDLDISILINNVGLSKRCLPFDESTDEDLKEILVLNCFPIVFMTKRILQKMLLRKSFSAIINLSSQEWHFPGRSPLYCASRAFEDMFAESLTNEFNKKIDFLSYTPLYISNSQHKYNKNSFWNIDPHQGVSACLKEIGYERKTYGHWKHKLIARWMQMLNDKGRRTYAKLGVET